MLGEITTKIKDLSHSKTLRRIIPASMFITLHSIFRLPYYHKQISQRVDENTILLADYPRCGIGWLRFVLSSALHLENKGEILKLNHDQMHKYAPTLAGRVFHKAYRFGNDYNLLKTHYRYDQRFKKAVVIYRDPFKAIRSYYAHQLMEEGSIITRPYRGLSRDDSFLISQAEDFIRFYQSWLFKLEKDPGNFFLLKYEDLLSNPVELFSGVFDFLNIELNARDIDKLANLYRKEDVSTPLNTDKSPEEAFRDKAEIINRITPVMTSENLKRLNPGLEERLNQVMIKLDSLRKRIELKKVKINEK
ncbi:MAG: sulfotransferase domain-containing protein [Candidatus Omnitrophica bacterium]|nr:sulfotransferase domain-containing protein [Candidatus Omnitrophota bacterium]